MEITIMEREEENTLVISENVGTFKLAKVMGPAYQSILDHCIKNKVKKEEMGVPFTKYRKINWEDMKKQGIFSFIYLMFFHKWNIDIGIPCPATVPESGRMKKLRIEPGKFLRTIHKGPYKDVGKTYTEILKYAEENNMKLKDHSFEFYMNDPRVTEEGELETEVLVPVTE